MVGKLRVGDDGFADIGIVDVTIVRLAFPGGLRCGSGCRATKLGLWGGMGGEARARPDGVLVRYKRPREKPHGERRRLSEGGHCLRVSGVITTRDGSRSKALAARASDGLTNACMCSRTGYC